MADSRYAKNTRAVFSLKHHIVRCPKYRCPVLVPPVDAWLKAPLKDIAHEHDMTIHTLEVMPELVHLFVEADPRLCVGEIVARFKGRTSHDLRQEFVHLRLRVPTLWSRNCVPGTVGIVSAAVIHRDIEAQNGP